MEYVHGSVESTEAIDGEFNGENGACRRVWISIYPGLPRISKHLERWGSLFHRSNKTGRARPRRLVHRLRRSIEINRNMVREQRPIKSESRFAYAEQLILLFLCLINPTDSEIALSSMIERGHSILKHHNLRHITDKFEGWPRTKILVRTSPGHRATSVRNVHVDENRFVFVFLNESVAISSQSPIDTFRLVRLTYQSAYLLRECVASVSVRRNFSFWVCRLNGSVIMLDEYRSRASFCPDRMRRIFEDEPSQAYRVGWREFRLQ